MTTPPTPTGPNRRQVLCGLAAALAAPGLLAACSSGPTSIPVSQIPIGGGTLVRGSRTAVLVVRPSAAVIKAYDARCPHQGSIVDPPAGGVITCPNHHSRFDAATGALRTGPATRGLAEVAVTVANGTVTVT